MFNAFNISKVPVYKDALNEKLTEVVDESYIAVQPEVILTFKTIYVNAVEQFKREFKNWEAGAKVDITKVRAIILPLIDIVLEDRTIIFDLNEYSNPKDYLYHHCIATGIIQRCLLKN